MKALTRLPVFFVIFLIVLLPVSVSAQLADSTSYVPVEQQYAAEASDSDFSAQATCTWPDRECAGKCWTPCASGSTWYCGSSSAYCCSNENKFCADQCWTPCSSSNIWVCKDSGAVCEPKSKCTDSKYPYPCGGTCWSGCGSGYRFECISGSAQCKLESCTDSSYPYYCGNKCWGCNPSSSTFTCDSGNPKCCPSDKPYYWDGGCQKCPSDKKFQCGDNCYTGSECGSPDYPYWNCKQNGDYTCCPKDFPVYCDKNGICWKNGPECENSQKCGDEGWTVCRDPAFSAWNCKPDGKSICCPTDKPYYVDGECRKCPADKPKQCGNQCYGDSNCESGKVAICDKYDNVECCPSEYPNYCGRIDRCTKNSDECDKAQKCGSEGWTVCRDTNYPNWNCRSDGVSRCCPTGYPYLWNNDYLCHTTPESTVTCTVPDGTAQCDCNSNSDCPAGKPFCEENYPSPISDGYDACVSSVPEYCGNGKCAGGETYSNCQADCAQNAPKGTINVDVYYSSGANANKPISGAYVYLDGVSKGTTDSSGKKSFEAAYGNRNVKVECPDKAFCSEKSVGVDGTEYVSLGCNCKSSVSFSSLRARFKAKTNAYPKGYPVANVDVLIDNSLKGSSNQFGAVDIEGLTTGAHQLGVYLKLLEDGQEKIYTGGTSLTLSNPYEEKVYVLVKGNSPSATYYMALESGNEAFALHETNVTPEIVWIPIILAVVWIAGTAWDAYDYKKCVERQATAWDPNKEDWSKFECNNEMDEEQLNDCVNKLLSKNQNTIESCDFQTAMVALNFIPVESYLKTGGKLAVRIGKAARIIPFIDDAAQGGYRVYKTSVGSEVFVRVSDGVKGYTFKLVDNTLKIVENVVGMIVKLMKRPEVIKKITDATNDLLSKTRPSDLPNINVKDFGNIKGELGERAAVKNSDIVGEELIKEGSTFVRPAGNAKEVFKQSTNYKLQFDNKGKIEVMDRISGNTLGDLDDFYFVNRKPIVSEVKTKVAVNLDDEILNKRLAAKVIRRLQAVEEVTGEVPEFIIMLPKGEATASRQLKGFLDAVSNAGFKAEHVELGATSSAFDDAARRISIEAKLGG